MRKHFALIYQHSCKIKIHPLFIHQQSTDAITLKIHTPKRKREKESHKKQRDPRTLQIHSNSNRKRTGAPGARSSKKLFPSLGKKTTSRTRSPITHVNLYFHLAGGLQRQHISQARPKNEQQPRFTIIAYNARCYRTFRARVSRLGKSGVRSWG